MKEYPMATIKKDGSNLHEWNMQSLAYLGKEGIQDYVDGTSPPPERSEHLADPNPIPEYTLPSTGADRTDNEFFPHPGPESDTEKFDMKLDRTMGGQK
jgi:hypothetical protein